MSQVRKYKFKRIARNLAILGTIGGIGYYIHEKDYPYLFAFKKLKENTEKTPKWAMYLAMGWGSWIHAHHRSVLLFIFFLFYFVCCA